MLALSKLRFWLLTALSLNVNFWTKKCFTFQKIFKNYQNDVDWAAIFGGGYEYVDYEYVDLAELP